jgi:hypothetical protein
MEVTARDTNRYAPEQLSGVTRVEAGLNTSTVTLRVVGGDEKGSLKSETVKYGSSERAPHKNKAVTVTQVIKLWS